MSIRTIIGNLAADPEAVTAGKATLAKFTVIENTGEYRKGEFVADDTATNHYVEAWFDLGQNVLASLVKGTRVVVFGAEHTESYDKDGQPVYRRILKATSVAPDLAYARATVTPVPRENSH